MRPKIVGHQQSKLQLAGNLLTVVLLCGALGFGQHSGPRNPSKHLTQDSVPQAHSYATGLFQNADLTVRRLNIPPQSEEPIPASTHDYLLISIGRNSVTVKGDVNSFDLTLGPGEMQVIDGGWKHAIVDTGPTEAELYFIEPSRNIDPKSAICGLGAKPCSEHRFGESAQGTYNQFVQFETETAKLVRLTMGAGVATHLHEDPNKHLIVALTPFTGHNDGENFDLKAGDMRWIPKGFEELGNDGPKEVRALVLELK